MTIDLKTATSQEVYDYVIGFLYEQGQSSTRQYGEYDTPSCAYRGDRNRMCAAGCLIPDYVYSLFIEGKTVTQLEQNPDDLLKYHPRLRPFLEWYQGNMSPHYKLVTELQALHDAFAPAWDEDQVREYIVKQAKRIAARFNLQPFEITQ